MFINVAKTPLAYQSKQSLKRSESLENVFKSIQLISSENPASDTPAAAYLDQRSPDHFVLKQKIFPMYIQRNKRISLTRNSSADRIQNQTLEAIIPKGNTRSH